MKQSTLIKLFPSSKCSRPFNANSKLLPLSESIDNIKANILKKRDIKSIKKSWNETVILSVLEKPLEKSRNSEVSQNSLQSMQNPSSESFTIYTEKCKELIDANLQIPVHFKYLIKIMKALDDTIHFYKKRGKPTQFKEIRVSVEKAIGRIFTITHFKQILKADPSLYSYQIMSGGREEHFIVDIPEDNSENVNLAEYRILKLKIALMMITYQWYQKFIEKLKKDKPIIEQEVNDFDPIRQKSWHREFDPNNQEQVPLIVPFIFEERINKSRNDKLSELVNNSKQTNNDWSLSKNSLSTENKEKVNTSTLFSTFIKKKQENCLNETIKGVPSDLLKRIQDKEKQLNEAKEKIENENKSNKSTLLKEFLLKIIESLRSIYTVKGVNSIYLSKLLQELEDSQRGSEANALDFNEWINHLQKASPNWLKLINHPNGTLVKINPDYRKISIRNDIENFIKAY